jgi:hypothetical protein
MFGQNFVISTGLITSFTSTSCGQANDAVMVDAGVLTNNHFYRSRPMLAAPPFGLIQSSGGVKQVRVDLCPAWQKAFNDFQNQMLNGGYGFRSKIEGTSYDAQALTGGGGLAPIQVVVNNAFTPPAGTLVHVRGFRVHPSTRIPLAGMWRSLAPVTGPLPGTNAIGLADSELMPPATAYKMPGSIQTAAAQYVQYGQFDIDTGVTRKRGGNLELPRGRARTRVFRGS